MAYSSTRVKPAITTATDAGLAIDDYLDGEVDQLYTNTNYLLAAMATAAYGGPYFFVGTSAEVASLTTITDGMNLHATDTAKQFFVSGTTKYEFIDEKHDQSIAGSKSFSTVTIATLTCSTTATMPAPSNDSDAARLDTVRNIAAIYSQAF